MHECIKIAVFLYIGIFFSLSESLSAQLRSNEDLQCSELEDQSAQTTARVVSQETKSR